MRYRVLKVAPEVLVAMCKRSDPPVITEVVANPLPADTALVRSFTKNVCGVPTVYLVVESAEFDDLPEGEQMPEHPPVVFKASLPRHWLEQNPEVLK